LLEIIFEGLIRSIATIEYDASSNHADGGFSVTLTTSHQITIPENHQFPPVTQLKLSLMGRTGY